MALDAENAREWAVEIQEETMQTLLALRLTLASALRDGGREELARAASDAHERLAPEIHRLRGLTAAMRSGFAAPPSASSALAEQPAVDRVAD